TFDVCILKVATSAAGEANFAVLGKAGIPRLGGDDFDDALMKLLSAEVVKTGGPDVLDLKKDQGVSKKKLRGACQVLKEKAGAAIIGATFGALEEKKIQVQNSTSHFLGIETHGRRFSTILDKNVDFPTENTKQFTTAFDNQTELRITVFQFPEKTEHVDMKIP